MIKKLLQKIQQNKILLAIVIILGMSLTYPISVYADTNFEASFATLGASFSADECRYIIQKCREKGLNEIGTAAVIANMAAEGAWNKVEGNYNLNCQIGGKYEGTAMPKSNTDGNACIGQGVGIIMWSPADSYFTESVVKDIDAKEHCGYFTVTRYVAEWEKTGKKFGSTSCKEAINNGWITKKTVLVPGFTGQMYYLMEVDGDHGFAGGHNVSELNSKASASEATGWYYDHGVRGSSAYRGAHVDKAEAAYATVLAYDGKTYIPEEITGPQDDEDGEVTPTGDGKDGYNENTVEYDLDSIYEDLEEKGFITSDQLGAYYKLKEENLHLDDLRRDEFGAIINEDGELTAEEAEQYSENLRQLSQWEANVEGEKITLTKVLRWICMFVGILMIIWVLFLYIAYWFDRINTLVPFSVLSIVSFGHYVVSDNEDTSDVNMTNPEKTGKMKQINHKGIILICLITIIIASFLLSGVLFNWMRYAIMWVQQKLSQLTLG